MNILEWGRRNEWGKSLERSGGYE